MATTNYVKCSHCDKCYINVTCPHCIMAEQAAEIERLKSANESFRKEESDSWQCMNGYQADIKRLQEALKKLLDECVPLNQQGFANDKTGKVIEVRTHSAVLNARAALATDERLG